jgi:predicted nucleic acid-binding protein
MIRTYIDTGVLFWAHRGEPVLAAKAIGILDDPNREFVSSIFLRLETLPKAVYHKNQDEIVFYESFFSGVTEWASPLDTVIQDAYQAACTLGIAAFDAFHVAAAIALHADELVTTEKPEKPIHRVKSLKVTTLYMPPPSPATPANR